MTIVQIVTTMARKFVQAVIDKHTTILDKASTSLSVNITPTASILPNRMEQSLYYSQPARLPPSHSRTALAGTLVRIMPKEMENWEIVGHTLAGYTLHQARKPSCFPITPERDASSAMYHPLSGHSRRT